MLPASACSCKYITPSCCYTSNRILYHPAAEPDLYIETHTVHSDKPSSRLLARGTMLYQQACTANALTERHCFPAPSVGSIINKRASTGGGSAR